MMIGDPHMNRGRALSGAMAAAPAWPDLCALGMSEDLQRWRMGGIGGSDANVIFSGDPNQIIELWEIKRGGRPAPDLSKRLPVMLGNWTEPFNRLWFEQETGMLIEEVGSAFSCPIHAWRRATVDGVVMGTGAVWEAKHTSAFAKPEEIVARYMPQLQHNMAVTGSENSILSVIYGNHRWETYEVGADWLYQDALLGAERQFWDCVLVGIPPAAIDPPAPPKPDAVRELSFEGNNEWAIAAWDWLDTADSSRRHSAAATAIKGLLDDDVSRAFGHGIEVKRSKAGALTIRRHDA